MGSLLLLWALAYALVPMLLKWQLEKTGSEKLGRQVTVGAVDFRPWSLELTLHDLAIAKAGAAEPPERARLSPGVPQIKIARHYIDAEMQSLLRLAPVADAIEVDGLALALTHLGQGRYDVDDILARLKPPADAPASDPLRFALYNLVLGDARLDFVDLPAGRTHAVRDLHLSIPFLSNLRSQREVKTSPHLAFRLNGSRFDTAAVGTPFAQTRKTDATLALRGLDLRPYLAYWPESLPFRLESAVLNADIKLAFEQAPATVMRVSGTATAEQVRLLDTQAGRRELLSFDRLEVGLDDVRPLERSVKLSAVTLSAPTFNLSRDRAGRLNLLPPEDEFATKNRADGARAERATGQNDVDNGAKPAVAPSAGASMVTPVPPPGASAAAAPWRVQVDRVAVRQGKLNWLDETLTTPAQIGLSGLTLDASAIAYPFSADAPLKFEGEVGLAQPVATSLPAGRKAAVAAQAPGAPQAATALLRFSGSATDQAARLTASVAAWPLNMAARYVGQFLLPALNGQLDAQLGVNWQAAGAGKAQVLQLSAPQMTVSDVQLAQGKTSLVSVKKVELLQADIDLMAQTLKAASMQLVQPKARVERGSDKRWMYERWRLAQAKAPPPPPATGGVGAPAWSVAINEVQLEGGAMSFSDKAGASPVSFEVSAANARLGSLVLDDRVAAKTMPLSASLRLASGRFEPGRLAFNGSIGLTPVQAQGRLVLDRLPLQAFEPYLADALNIELLRADASFKGRVAYRQTAGGPVAQLNGDLALEEFRANTLAPSEELLAWKALSLRGLQVALDPARATKVDVRETVLTDFFARVIVTPEGRINLQDLAKASAHAAPDAPETIAGEAISERAGGLKQDRASGAAAPVAPAAQAVAASGRQGPAPVITIGPVRLVNGRVLFSDRFVKPNYTANLSELSGQLSAFSSVASGAASGAAPAMANLELRGKAEGTASLEVLGKLNPLARPLALDITGKVRDLELPPLSPYAVKYAGYGINRGKLSVDVSYVVLPDGRLTASNKLVLKQLSFGDKVEGAAASLPVKLAVALLADRNGVIDIDLPISGSLNDPQFSLGPVIVKVIFNLIAKAITSPFSLLAGAFGGSAEELGVVGFSPGSSLLASESKAGLDKVSKALTDRPALQLTVVGASSLETERDGLRRAQLAAMVQAEKRRAIVREGGSTADIPAVSPAEYPALLKQVYQRADMAKPRNLVGLAKDLPVAGMEKLLMADMPADDNAMRELAVQRAVVVRDYLAAGGVSPARIFLGAPKNASADAKWTPRAELNLAMP
ncbi:DUF748 domain-containing protein [Polaromonas sp.]|uniref:DUF748 domain-containing protein n=1 Tax=Polaromonas sp. TaxID=1869339 RepID=UPI002488A5FA|nr:DUF748 domain-containing protein [Polaromonas sp.]MDI1275797.1 DUF748 domain-containing protein [Polaromonas sp.]